MQNLNGQYSLSEQSLMNAVICTKYGAPEVLELQEVKTPEPKDDEVRIRIHFTSVTASDSLIRGLEFPFLPRMVLQMIFGFGKPRNPIMGMVCAGVVDKVGKNVTKFKVGDEVVAYGSKSPTKRRFGSYAEFICLPEDWFLTKKPSSISFKEAAAIPYGGLIADFYTEKAGIQPGQKVLIYGASGSIGTAALQLAKHIGVEVTAVCSARNFGLVEYLGADKMIDYTSPDAVSQLEEYDVVLDAVGETKTSDVKEVSKHALRDGGRYVSVDNGTPNPKITSFMKIIEMAGKGELKPVIDRTFSLTDIVEAHHYVDRGHKKGNVMIEVNQ